MKPPYQVSDKILGLVASISEKLGEINAVHLHKPSTALRKRNRIKTIQSSLEIEGNTLDEDQITALLENKRVTAPQKDILEVENAILVYDQLQNFNPNNIKDLERVHGILMKGLIENAGKLRTKNVGIVQGTEVKHLAPEGSMVRGLMKDLMSYLKSDEDIPLIKSCVFHYEFEFIHPFADGNRRMGRLWQTLILMQKYPVFEFLPVESLIKENQKDYYYALEQSDNSGESTLFIEWMLGIILQALENLQQMPNRTLTTAERIEIFKDKIKGQEFGRKDYLQNFKEISQATASRDLRWAVEQKILVKTGDKRLTRYHFRHTT